MNESIKFVILDNSNYTSLSLHCTILPHYVYTTRNQWFLNWYYSMTQKFVLLKKKSFLSQQTNKGNPRKPNTSGTIFNSNITNDIKFSRNCTHTFMNCSPNFGNSLQNINTHIYGFFFFVCTISKQF